MRTSVELHTRVSRLFHEDHSITGVEVTANGATRRVPASHVISTTTIPQLVASFNPALPAEVEATASRCAR